MKKLSSKFIASAVMAVVMSGVFAVSASAAIDYLTVPTYTPPAGGSSSQQTGNNDSGNTDSGNTDTSDDETDKSESVDASVVDESAVKDAIENGDEIDVVVEDGDAVVQEAAIGEIAKADAPVVFEVADDDSDIDYKIVIDPESIEDVKAINLAMNITTVSGNIVITPAQKGEFGMTLNVVIPVSAFDGIDLDIAELYYIADNGETTLIPDGFSVVGDEVIIPISHASAYVISEIDLTAVDLPGTDVDDDDDDDDDDEDVTIDQPEQGKDDTTVVNPGTAGNDSNPVTGTTLALGSLAVFAAAAVATSKKRK